MNIIKRVVFRFFNHIIEIKIKLNITTSIQHNKSCCIFTYFINQIVNSYIISFSFRHLKIDSETEIDVDDNDFQYSNDEINILKKISEWPKCIDTATKKLEPHRIPTYLYELASLFHSYWNLGKDNPEKRFINDEKKITTDKLILLKVISDIVKSGMNIVGVSTPEKM